MAVAASKSTKNKLFKKFVQMALSALLTLLLTFSLLRYITEPQDKTRCHGMLNEGHWMTEEYKEWQPSGCMAKSYGEQDISECLNHTKIVYIGDSIMREQYYSMGEFLKFNRPKQDAIHEDQKLYSKNHDLSLEMWWDPYLNSSRTVDLFQGKADVKPSLLIVGSGVWYMRRTGANYLELWKKATDRIFDGAIHLPIADKMMFAPVEIVQSDLLIPERVATLTIDKITIMNNYLRERESNLHNAATPLVVPFVWNDIVTHSKNQTSDGLHFKAPVTSAQAQLALNYRCNEQIVKKSFPMDQTCCFNYSAPVWYQSAIFIFFLIFVPIGFCLLYSSSDRIINIMQPVFPSEQSTLLALFVFGVSVIYMYLGDRSQLFGKMYKQFDVSIFSILMFAMILLGFVTIKFNRNDTKDAGFLNRDQTDEWKGWMQLVILIYHFVGASRIAGIYNPVRVLVAAYLFQTGYGHFFFFYKKADYGIARIWNVLIRLNLLTCVLAYLMKTDYLFYYFSPLVSFWFGVIWITMRIVPTYNQKSLFVVSKILVMSIITGIIINYPGVLEGVFNVLNFLFKIQWNVVEWRFRLSLDAWIVYVGMICALITIKLDENKVYKDYASTWKIIKMVALLLSFVGLAGFFVFELKQTKASYTIYHPYISWVPILSFVIIRNFCRFGRNSHSRFFAFIGKISLETFIGQFHMWLAADTKGLLVVLPNAAWVIKSRIGWWTNLAVSSLVFIFICYHLSQATGVLTRWLCSGVQNNDSNKNPARNNFAAVPTNNVFADKSDSVPLLPTISKGNAAISNNEDMDSALLATNKIGEPAELPVERVSEESIVDIDEEWDESLSYKTTWYKSFYDAIVQNYWIRSLVYLIVMGTVNRLCI